MDDKWKLKNFERVVFFTGAGISAESGVPTFRGKGGLWDQYKPEEYACQEAFDRDPQAVWEFHDKRREIVAGCKPNAAHHHIAAYEKEHPNTVVVTQNIDGFHQDAGTQNLYEMHGSLWHVRCDASGTKKENRDIPFPIEDRSPAGEVWRPDIVWFGDYLNEDTIQKARNAFHASDLVVIVGTSGVVWPAAGFPLEAQKRGATLIEINPEESDFSIYCDLCLRGPATQELPKLL